jgi:ribosomal protein S18 acetylase RimI-like enzyme
MNIQRLSKSHAAEYRALMLEAYQLHADAFTSSYPERAALPLSWWESRLEQGQQRQPSELVLGVLHENRLAGVAGLSFQSREKARHKATLFGMYVPSRYRRLGLGHQLVRAILSEAKCHPSVKLVQLTVTHGNRAAQSLYERCGFVEFGLEPYAVAVGEGFVSKVHMWCDIGGLGGERA